MPEPLPHTADGRLDDEAIPQGEEPKEPITISFFHAGWAILLSLTVLGLIGYFTFDASAFGQLLTHLNPWYLLAAVATVIVRVLLGGWRLCYIARNRISVRGGMRGQLAWDFFSNVTPSAIGGAPVAALYMARDTGRRVGETTAVMLFSMLLDQLWFVIGIPLLLLASLFFDVFPDSLGRVGTGAFVLYFVGMMAWMLFFAYAMLVRPDVLERLVNRLFRLRWLRRFQDRAEREVSQLRRRAQILRSQRPMFYVNGVLLTAGTWVARYLTLVFVVWSVYAAADGFRLLLRTTAMLLGSLVMPTPGGSGGIEGLYALFIAPLMPPEAVAPTLLTWRLLAYYIFIALGVYLTMHQVRKSFRRRTDEQENGHALSAEVALPDETAVHAEDSSV